MTESVNLALAMSSVLHGHGLPREFLALAVLSAGAMLFLLVADRFRGN